MKKIEIKESITRKEETMYIVVLTIFISLQLNYPKAWLLIPIAIFLFLISRIIKRLIDRKPASPDLLTEDLLDTVFKEWEPLKENFKT